jgi:putative ABC transport system permease protein
MVYLLIAAAALLSDVVFYNIGLLSFTEMEREMATLKVMGLKSAKLRGLLLTQSLWFSARVLHWAFPEGCGSQMLLCHSPGMGLIFQFRFTGRHCLFALRSPLGFRSL